MPFWGRARPGPSVCGGCTHFGWLWRRPTYAGRVGFDRHRAAEGVAGRFRQRSGGGGIGVLARAFRRAGDAVGVRLTRDGHVGCGRERQRKRRCGLWVLARPPVHGSRSRPRCTQFRLALHANRHASRSFRALGARCTQFCNTVHAVEAWYTQLKHGTRSFFSDPREGPPHLPARLMLHAVFGASETACTVSHLRVALAETACTVPFLRVAWTETACTILQLREPCVGGQRPAASSPHGRPAQAEPLRQRNPSRAPGSRGARPRGRPRGCGDRER